MSERQIINLRPSLDVLYYHRVGVVCVLAAGLGMTACALLMIPRAYRSSIRLVEEPPEVASSYIAEPAFSDTLDRIQRLSESAFSRQRLAQIVRAFNLYPRQRAAHQPIDKLTDLMRRSIAIKPIDWRQRRSRGPEALELSFEYPVPALAQAVANRLSRTLVEADHAQRAAAAAAAERVLRDEMTGVRDRLDTSGAEIKAFEQRHAGALPDEMTGNLQQLDRLQEQLSLAAEAMARARAVSSRTRLKTMETRLAVLRTRYSDAYPDVVALRAAIGAIKKQTAADPPHPAGARFDGVPTVDGDGASAEDGARKRHAALLRQIVAVRERIAETPANEEQLSAFRRDYSVLSDNYARLMRRHLRAQAIVLLQRRGEGERLRIVEPASLPLEPARPNWIAVLALGTILSLTAALALPFGLAVIDSSFRDPEELAREHASPVPIAIPELKELRKRRGARSALVVGDSSYGRANDEFQMLCAMLLSLAAGQDKHLFAVTSALAGEGKSFVALNLATSLARSGARVLLIDANLKRPSLHQVLQIEPRGGTSDCLSGRASFEASIRATQQAGLAVIPAGAITGSSAAELFASPRMGEFVTAARAAYARDFVVIDCAPVLRGVETQIIARMADALVMVIAANRTPRDSVARALGRLNGAAIAGMVLNRFAPSYSCRAEYLAHPAGT